MFASKDTLLTRPSGYNIARSVRLRSSASGYLTRTPASAGNQKTWTWSGWVKRGIVSGATQQNLFSVSVGTTDLTSVQCTISTSNTLYIVSYTTSLYLETTQVFRDPSAWYHIVVSLDTTQATSSNRAKIYVNGTQVTALSSAVYPSQNSSYAINSTGAFDIGRFNQGGGIYYFDGYLTEINFIDGQALTPSSFGSTNAITGVWQPAKYTGTYGTNGFYLNFSDNSNNTATTIGKDYSGNGNNWTPNNISVTAGATYDSMVDSPTLSGASSNYCTLNPLKTGTTYKPTISNGNLQLASATATQNPASSTIGAFTGKWYFEAVVTNLAYLPGIGVCDPSVSFGTGDDWRTYAKGVTLYSNGTLFTNSSSSSTAYVYLVNDVIGVAFDSDTGKVWIAKNNTWFNSGNPSAGTGQVATATGYASLAPVFDGTTVGTNDTIVCNFGQRPFSYTPPTGFVALNTYNLPDSTIKNGAGYMAATTYTGTGANRSVSNAVNGVGFQPDWVWMKARSAANSHYLANSVMGVGFGLLSDATNAQVTVAAGKDLTSFDAAGFSLGPEQSFGSSNTNGTSIVAWQWKAGGTSSSNTNGSITSTVSVGATQGFSVVTYTGTGANATVGHGLGVAPQMIIIKGRDTGYDWRTYHASVGNTSALFLNTTSGSVASSTYWNNTSPTSSVFSVGSNAGMNGSTNTYVAYCFSAVAGYSAFGSYTGNGSTDGPFVYTGFRPRFVMLKRTDSANDWFIIDTSRNTYNVAGTALYPNSSSSETSNGYYDLDVISNGFKARTTNAVTNASGGTYIYACFSENPFKNALAR